MARVWSCGFELNSLTDGIEITTKTSGNALSTTTVRSGAVSHSIASLVSTTAKGIRQRVVSPEANGPFFARAYYRYATLPTAENTIIQLNDTLDFAAPVARITIDSGGLLRLYDEDGVIGSASSALSANTWYRIEIQFDRTAAAGSHVLRAKLGSSSDLSEVEFAGASNRDIVGGVESFNWGGNLNSEAQTTGAWFFDDLAFNNSTGSFQNSYPGPGRIIHLSPNGNGDNSQWTGSDADSTDNYLLVDETTPDDVTTYVESNTSGQIDDYNIAATPAAMGSSDVINVLHVGARFAVSDATGADPDFVLRIKASASGTVEESTTIDVANVSYTTNNSSTVLNYLFTIYDLPSASTTAWTKADLDQAQIGVRESVTDTHFVRLSTIWLLVDYKPSVVTGGRQAIKVRSQAVKRASTW